MLFVAAANTELNLAAQFMDDPIDLTDRQAVIHIGLAQGKTFTAGKTGAFAQVVVLAAGDARRRRDADLLMVCAVR